MKQKTNLTGRLRNKFITDKHWSINSADWEALFPYLIIFDKEK